MPEQGLKSRYRERVWLEGHVRQLRIRTNGGEPRHRCLPLLYRRQISVALRELNAMRIQLSISRSIVHSLAAYGRTRFSIWRRHVARRRLRQTRARRLRVG